MNEEEIISFEDVEVGKLKNVQNKKDEFDSLLENIKNLSDAIEFHSNVKAAVSKDEVDNNYLRYIENSLEDRLFSNANFDKIDSTVLLEIICPELTSIENFVVEKLEIEDIGSHFEEQEKYIDKICTYNGKFVSLFGVNENNTKKVIKYEARKFSRTDMIDAICQKLEEGKTVQMEQYDEYYVVTDGNSLKIFSERKAVSLMKVEETVFDKMKNKLFDLFHNSIFSKKKYLPNIELVYDNNPNRFKNFKHTSKIDAKSRMKTLLNKEREITRANN